MEITIQESSFLVFTRNLDLKEYPTLNQALEAQNIFCVVEMQSGRLKYTNTAGYRDVEHKAFKLYSHDGNCAERLQINGCKLRLGDCGYRGKTFSPVLNVFTGEFTSIDGTIIKEDFDLDKAGITSAIEQFKALSDTKEDLINDTKRLIDDVKVLKTAISGLYALSLGDNSMLV